jgi:ligand-binding SRPBCC domain-containing protein
MLKVEKSIFINKPVEEVYAFISGEGNFTKWQPQVSEVIEGGPRNTVGSQFTEVRKFMGQELRTTYQILEQVPYERWVGKVVKGPVPYEVTNTYEKVNGGTKYTTRVVGETTGFFKIAEGLVTAQLEKSLGEDLQRLKEILEKA